MLSRCTYKEEYTPEHVYIFTGKCIVTGKDYSVTLPAKGLYKYNNGAYVQDAFPELSVDDREFIISGMSPEAFSGM